MSILGKAGKILADAAKLREAKAMTTTPQATTDAKALRDLAEREGSVDEAIKMLPAGWRFSVGDIPHWYGRDDLPKALRRKGFEAYVMNGEMIGTKDYIFQSADGATPAAALTAATAAALRARAAQMEGK